jgi:hypothetical protein
MPATPVWFRPAATHPGRPGVPAPDAIGRLIKCQGGASRAGKRQWVVFTDLAPGEVEVLTDRSEGGVSNDNSEGWSRTSRSLQASDTVAMISPVEPAGGGCRGRTDHREP